LTKLCSCCEGYALDFFVHLLLLPPLLLLLGDIVTAAQLLFWALVFFLLRARATDKGSGVKLTHSWKQGPRSFSDAPICTRAFVSYTTHFDFPGKRRLPVKAAV
jgi:hypothetical protein